jgi:hypothetical protein
LTSMGATLPPAASSQPRLQHSLSTSMHTWSATATPQPTGERASFVQVATLLHIHTPRLPVGFNNGLWPPTLMLFLLWQRCLPVTPPHTHTYSANQPGGVLHSCASLHLTLLSSYPKQTLHQGSHRSAVCACRMLLLLAAGQSPRLT